jgi:hypothetical protein
MFVTGSAGRRFAVLLREWVVCGFIRSVMSYDVDEIEA